MTKKLRISYSVSVSIDVVLLCWWWAIPLVAYILDSFYTDYPLTISWVFTLLISITFYAMLLSPVLFKNESWGMRMAGIRIVDANCNRPPKKFLLLRSAYYIRNAVEDILRTFSGEDMDGVGLSTSGTQLMFTENLENCRRGYANELRRKSTVLPSKVKIPVSYSSPVLKIIIAALLTLLPLLAPYLVVDILSLDLIIDASEIRDICFTLSGLLCFVNFVSCPLLIRGIAEIMFIRDERKNLPSPEEQDKLECERCKSVSSKDELADFCTDTSCENNSSQDIGDECSLDVWSIDYKAPLGEPSDPRNDDSSSEEKKEKLTPFKLFEKKFLTPDKTLTSYKYPLIRLAIFYGIIGVYAILFSLMWQITRLGSDVAITLFLIMFPVMFILVYCEARLLFRIIVEFVNVWKNKRTKKLATTQTNEDEKMISKND